MTALEMDEERRDLFVEGPSDRALLLFLVGDELNPQARVLFSNHLDLPHIEGGERGRLVHIASKLRAPQVHCFVDADWDRILSLHRPDNATWTDHRDTESYMWTLKCLAKAIAIGIGQASPSAEDVLAQIIRVCSETAAVRLLAVRKGWKLPFSDVDLTRQLLDQKGVLSLDTTKYVTVIWQNALPEMRKEMVSIATVVNELSSCRKELSTHPWRDFIHGKDALQVLGHIFRQKVDTETTNAALRCSFEKEDAAGYECLMKVVAWISKKSGGLAQCPAPIA